jgi:hypothetical protein
MIKDIAKDDEKIYDCIFMIIAYINIKTYSFEYISIYRG